ncbi:MAG: ISL3 family transposase [Acidimicrobiales bacterium]
MRVTTLGRRLLDLDGITVTRFDLEGEVVIAEVALRRRRLACPRCGFSTRSRYDTRAVSSRWRGLDLGRHRVSVRARLRRLACPTHGVVTEGVPFARPGSGFTTDFEGLVAYLATKTDKSTITRLCRIDWDTVGRICERVVADGLDPSRLDGLVSIGVDEVSWRRRHHYLTLITDHQAKKIVWGAPGKDAATLDEFFADLAHERADRLEAISMDMGPAFAKSARQNALNATRCIDPYHCVQLVTEALDVERRKAWNELRQLPDQSAAKTFKGARWVLLKRPENLSEDQAVTLRKLRNRGGAVWRAYSLKEAFRAVFVGDLDEAQTITALDRWCSVASRSRLPAFVRVSKTIRKHRDGILAAIELGINNARAEGLNNHVRLITRRAYGFHSATAALALVMLSCGPIDLRLPHERVAT